MATLLCELANEAPQPENDGHVDYETPEKAHSRIDEHPLVKNLRSQSKFYELPPYTMGTPLDLVSGLLLGPGRIEASLAWHEPGKSYIQICYVGSNLCGLPGIVHGGFLATMLDEGFFQCLCTAFPFNFMMTAHLDINYKIPTLANQFVVLRVKINSVDGRKARVEGQIERLMDDLVEAPTVLVKGTALFIQPKTAVSCEISSKLSVFLTM